ncbi:hypothetical protein QE152_g38661, partial [Popillia japonica]
VVISPSLGHSWVNLVSQIGSKSHLNSSSTKRSFNRKKSIGTTDLMIYIERKFFPETFLHHGEEKKFGGAKLCNPYPSRTCFPRVYQLRRTSFRQMASREVDQPSQNRSTPVPIARPHEDEDSFPVICDRELHSLHRNVPALRRRDVDTAAIRQHYYPEGGWGWLVCGAAFLAHLLTSGVQLAFGLLYLYTMKFLVKKNQEREFYAMATGGRLTNEGHDFGSSYNIARLIRFENCEITLRISSSSDFVTSFFGSD